MTAVSVNQLMIDVLLYGDPRENGTQTVTLSKLTGAMGLIMVWSEILLDGHRDMYVFPRGGIMEARHRSNIMEPIVRPHAGAV